MAQFLTELFGIPPQLIPVARSIAAVWNAIWWIALPLIALSVLWESWKIYLHWRFVSNLKFKLLEIKVPKNNLKTAKAMEQIFAAAHAPYSYGIRFWDKYWKGMEEPWMSFELVAHEGESHFYLRVPARYRNMMEAAVFSQYPDAEVTEAEDYLESMPDMLPNKDFTLDGFEEVLRHEDYRPIRTYLSFEDPIEERRVETMGGLLETMSKMRGDERLWYQVILVPTGEAFQKEGEKAIAKLLKVETGEEKKASFPSLDLGISLGEALRAPFQHPGEAQLKKESPQQKMSFIVASHDKERAEAIQKKIAKIAFNATVRFVYLEQKDAPSKPEYLMAIHGFVRQFNTQDLNSLKPNSPTTTAGYAVRGLFKQTRLNWRRHLLYEHYRHTLPAHHASVLNVEELATIFHFPIQATTTSELEKVESRKGTPPAALPVIE